MESKTKSRIVGGVSASALAVTVAILIPWLKKDEGLSLTAYEDVAGVWTGCYGHAYVQPGQSWTEEQCNAILEADTMAHLLPVIAQLRVPLSPKTLAAHAHFAFNIGVGAYAKSKTLKLTNDGDLAAGCRAMGNWFTAAGKDCRIRRNGCYGLINRRNDEISTCLAGLK